MYKFIRGYRRNGWDIIDAFRYRAFLLRGARLSEEGMINKFLTVIDGPVRSTAGNVGYKQVTIGDPAITIRNALDGSGVISDTKILMTLRNAAQAKTVHLKIQIFNSTAGGTIECEAKASGDYAKRAASYYFKRSLDYNMQAPFFRGICVLLTRKFINLSLLNNEQLDVFTDIFPSREIKIAGKLPGNDLV